MKQSIDKVNSEVTLIFDSALEAHLWGTGETASATCNADKQAYLASQEVGDRFSGVHTFEDSVEMAKSGWESGTANMLQFVKEIEASDELTQRGYDFDVTGDFFDVGEVVQGTPECWLTPAFEPAPRVISLCINNTHSSSVTSQQIQNRGAALMALIDRLQDTPGIIVDLTVHLTIGGATIKGIRGAGTINIMFPIGTSPLPMQEVGFIVAHPAMFRRGCIAAIERVGNYKPAHGYGNVRNLAMELQDTYSLYISNDPYENGMSSCDTVDGAVEWINQQLKKLGL